MLRNARAWFYGPKHRRNLRVLDYSLACGVSALVTWGLVEVLSR